MLDWVWKPQNDSQKNRLKSATVSVPILNSYHVYYWRCEINCTAHDYRNEMDLDQVTPLWRNKPVQFECSEPGQGSCSRSIFLRRAPFCSMCLCDENNSVSTPSFFFKISLFNCSCKKSTLWYLLMDSREYIKVILLGPFHFKTSFLSYFFQYPDQLK